MWSYLDCPVEMLHSSRCPELRDLDLSLHTGSACFEVRLAGGDMWLSLKLASLPSSFWKDRKHQTMLNRFICICPHRKKGNLKISEREVSIKLLVNRLCEILKIITLKTLLGTIKVVSFKQAFIYFTFISEQAFWFSNPLYFLYVLPLFPYLQKN